MARLALLLVGLALAVPATASAGSASIPLPPLVAASQPTTTRPWPAPELGPVVLSDGTVVIGLPVEGGRVVWERVAPGSTTLEPMWTEAVIDDHGDKTGPKTHLELRAAGDSYLVSRADYGACPDPSSPYVLGCHGVPVSSEVTLFGVHGEGQHVLSHCEGSACARCYAEDPYEARSEIAGDRQQVLVDPLCAGESHGPAVVDRQTGAVTPFALPPDKFGHPQAPAADNPFEIEGDYIASTDGVLNFRTNDYQHFGRGPDCQGGGSFGVALLPDGHAWFAPNVNATVVQILQGPLCESAPGQDDRRLSTFGYIDAASGNRVAIHHDNFYAPMAFPSAIVQSDGTVLGNLNVDSQFTGFAGDLAAGIEAGCRHDYLLLWDVAAGPPATPPSGCALPRLGPLRVGPRAVSVRASCPAAAIRDCGAILRLAEGRRAPRVRIRMAAGTQRWATLLGHLSGGRCRTLANRTPLAVQSTTIVPASSEMNQTKIRNVRAVGRCPRRAVHAHASGAAVNSHRRSSGPR